MAENTSTIPVGFCQCGCGQRTPLAWRTDRSRGWIEGQPVFYIHRHQRRTYQPCWKIDTITPDLAYVLGFILADGNVQKSRQAILTISNTDLAILQRMRDVLGTDAPIYLKTKAPSYRWYALTIYDPGIVGWLISMGITPKKSLDVRLPRIAPNLLSHLIRGYFDGDGTSSFSPRHGLFVKFTSGSPLLLEDVCRSVQQVTGIPASPITLDKNRTHAFRLKYTGRKAFRLASWLYADGDDLFIQRKRRHFDAYATHSGLPWCLSEFPTSLYPAASLTPISSLPR